MRSSSQPPPVQPISLEKKPWDMDSPTWPFYIVALLASLAVLLRALRRGSGRKLKLPPGPRPWPIVGNLPQMGELPHRAMHELAKKYGPLVHLQFGSFPAVVGSSLELAELMLKTKDISFAGRPVTAAGKYMVFGSSDITWSQYGPYWRQARKICTIELLSVRRLDSYENIRSEESHNLYTDIHALTGQTVALKEHLQNFNLNVITRMVLGRNYLKDSEAKSMGLSAADFRGMIDELFLLSGVFNIGDLIPWLDFLDLQGYVKRMKAVGKKFDQFLERVLDTHKAAMLKDDKFEAKAMVDVLIQFGEDPNPEERLSRTTIKALTQDMLAGGTEAAAVMVEWAMSALLKHPHVLDMARKELDTVIGKDRWVQESDIPRLTYMDGVIKETMRLFPVAPLLVPRATREDVKVGEYEIAAGTRVFVNTWSIMRDPSVWAQPDEFMPERFFGKEWDVKGTNFELLPFGSGRRMCPGYNLGLRMVQLVLCNLVHGFNWKLPNGMKPEDLDMMEKWGFSTPKSVPLEAVPEPRLPPHLYKF